jgi:hypothetical protein
LGFFRGNHVTRNIFHRNRACDLGLLRSGVDDRAVAFSDYNLFYDGEMEKGAQWAEWKRRGFDVNSAVGDPMFVDPEKDDYRLQPQSPAFDLGFVPIDPTKIGTRPKRS